MADSAKRYQLVLAELKRRNVLKVVGLYGAVVFVVMQVAEFLVPALHLPDSLSTVIALVAILGFPATMVLAWVYDMTRVGLVRTSPAVVAELQAIVAQPMRRRWPGGLFALAGLLLLVGSVWWRMGIDADSTPQMSSGADSSTASIALLPFVDMSGDRQNEYFSHGITKQLLSALTRVPGLKVAAPASAFAFEGMGVDVRTIGERLGVATVLVGSCNRSADGLRIAVQLVSAPDGTRLWSATYERQIDDIFAVQNEIALAIVGKLGITLEDGAQAHLVPPSTASVAAYDDFLRGKHFAEQHTLAALDSAIVYYNRALLLDPDYAAVYVALAEAYMLIPDFGGQPMVELLPYASAAAQRAMALGPDLAEVHAASAYLKWVHEWDREGAERDYQTAIELNPSYANAHYWYAQFLGTLRRWEEGLAEADRALALDPLSPGTHMIRGLLLLGNRRLADAEAAFQRSLELEPNFYTAVYLLALLYAMEGDYEAAAAMFERFAQLTGSDPAAFHSYLAALRDPNQRPAAVEALQALDFYGAMHGSELLAHLGEADAALAALEQAAQERSPYLPWANALPQFDALRSDPRFQAILAWMKL